MIELAISALAFIALLSAVMLYLWRTPAQQQPVTLRQPVRVSTRRGRREV